MRSIHSHDVTLPLLFSYTTTTTRLVETNPNNDSDKDTTQDDGGVTYTSSGISIDIEWTADKPCSSLDQLPAECARPNNPPGVWYSFLGNAEVLELEPYDCYERIEAVTMTIVAGNTCGILQCVQPPTRVSLCEGPNNDRIRLQTLPGVHYRIYIEHSNLAALEEDLPFTMYQKGIPSDFVEPDPTPAPTAQPTRATPSPTVAPTISWAPTPSPTNTPMPTYPGISLEWPHEMCPTITQQLSEQCGGGNSQNRQGGVWYSFTGNGQEVRFRPYTTCDPWTQVEMVIVMGSCEKGMLQCVQEEQSVDLCGNGQDILLQTLPGVFYQVWLGGADPDLLEEDFPFMITQLGIPKDFLLPEATPAPTGRPSLATPSPTAAPTRTPVPTPSPTSSPRPTYQDRDFEISWPYDMCDNVQALPDTCGGGSTSKTQGLWYEFFGTGHLMEFIPYCFEQMASTKMTIVMGSCEKNRLVCVQDEQVIPLCENNNKDPTPIRLQTIPGVHYQVFLEGDPRKLEQDFPFDFDELGIPDTIWPKTPSPTALPTIATPSPTMVPTVSPQPTPSPSSSPRPTYEMRDLEIEWPYEMCSNVQDLPDACGGLTLDTQGLWYEFYGNGHLIELQPYDCFEDMAETKMLIVMGSCERNMLKCVMEEQTVALCEGNSESILLQTIPRVHYMIFLQGDPRKLEKDLPFSFKELGVPENPLWPKTPSPTESPTGGTLSPTAQPTLSLNPTPSPSASPAPTYEMQPLKMSWPAKMCANVESLPATCGGNSPDRLGLWYEFWGNGHLIELKPYDCFDDMTEIKMTVVQGSCELNRLECVSEEQAIPFCGQQADSILLQTIPRVHYSVFLEGDPTKLKSDFPFSIVELGVPDTKWPFTPAPSAAPTRSQAPTSSTTGVGSTPVPTASETTTDASAIYDPLLEQDGQTTSNQSVPPLPTSSATPCGDDITIPSCPAPLSSGGEWYSVVGTGGPLVLLPICVETSPGTTVTVMQGDCEDGLVCVLETQSLDAACDFDDESFRRQLAPQSLPNFQSLTGVTYMLHVVHGDPSFSGNPLYVLPASGNFALTPTESPTPIGEGDLLTQEDAIAEEKDHDAGDSAKVASTKPPQASPDDETDDTVMIGAVIALALLMVCICCSCAACICVFYKRRREMEEKLVEKKQGNNPRRNNNNTGTEGTAHTRPMTEITGHSRGSWWNSNRDDDIFEGLEDEYECELKNESQESSTDEVEEDCQSMEKGLARIDIEGMDSMELSDSSMSVELKGCDGDSDDEEMDTLSRVTDFSTEISLGTMDEDELTTETDDMQSCGQFSLDTMESQEFLPTYTGQPSLDLLADASSVSEGDREDEDDPQSPELEKSHMISLGCSELNDSAWVSLGEIGDASDADENSSESDDDTVEDSASNNENSENGSESSGCKSEMPLNDENDDSDGDCDECTSCSDDDECISFSDEAELEEADESESCSHVKCPPSLDVDDDNTGDDCEDSSCTSEEGGFETDESERPESSLDTELNHQDAPKTSEVEGIDDGFDDASSTKEDDELENHESESSKNDEWHVSQTGNLDALEAGIEEQEEDEQVVDCDQTEEVQAPDYSHAEEDENTEMPITDSQESSRGGEDGGPSLIKEPTDSPTKEYSEENHGEIQSNGTESQSSEISDKKGIHEKEESIIENAGGDGEGLEEVDEDALLNEEVDLSNFKEDPTVSLADMLYQRRRWD